MKIGIVGAVGRMGSALVRDVLEHDDTQLSAALLKDESEIELFSSLSNKSMTVTTRREEFVGAVDALIDFSTPDNTLALAELAAKHGKIHVIGTTGLGAEQEQQLAEYANSATIVHSHNMSIGVNMLLSLVEQLANKLRPDSCDIEVVEMHHRHKVDAPSGTAISLGRAAAKGRGVKLDDVACYERSGNTGARPDGEIGFATLRGGGVVGDHTVIFAGEDERIELTHKASNRHIFSHGAIHAALWAKDQKPGKIYSMQDVLGL